jgi:hypothetical protein
VKAGAVASLPKVVRESFGDSLLARGYTLLDDQYMKWSDLGDSVSVRVSRESRQQLSDEPYRLFVVQLIADIEPFTRFWNRFDAADSADVRDLVPPGVIRETVGPPDDGRGVGPAEVRASWPSLWAYRRDASLAACVEALSEVVPERLSAFERYLDREALIDYVQEAFDQWKLGAVNLMSPGLALPFVLAGSGHTERYRQSLEWVRQGNDPTAELLEWLPRHYPE